MVSITGFTSARSLAIENAIIQSASIIANHLILTRKDGSTFDAGDINGGQQIPHTNTAITTAPTSAVGTNVSTFNNLQAPLSVSGFQKYRSDTKLVCEYAGSIFNSDPFGQFEVAINLGGVNTVLSNGFSRQSPCGIITRTGLVAGTYTINVYYRRVNGIGTVYDGNAGGKNCLKVTETF